jgi:membrane protease YdiL (CAAX protease family)
VTQTSGQAKQIPSRLQVMMVWVMAMLLAVVGGMLVSAIAGIVAVESGLTPDEALRLLNDPRSSPLVTSPLWICATIAVNELLVAATLVVWLRRNRANSTVVIPFGKPPPKAYVGALLVIMGFVPMVEIAGELTHRLVPREVTAETIVIALARGSTNEELAIVLACAALLPAIVEELMFRGLVMRAFLTRSHYVLVALFVPSLMFGLFHLDPSQVGGTIVLGVAFGLVRIYTGSLWPTMLGHLTYNTFIILDVRYGGVVGEHVLHWGRAAIGLGVAVVGLLVLMTLPGHTLPRLATSIYPRKRSERPSPGS